MVEAQEGGRPGGGACSVSATSGQCPTPARQGEPGAHHSLGGEWGVIPEGREVLLEPGTDSGGRSSAACQASPTELVCPHTSSHLPIPQGAERCPERAGVWGSVEEGQVCICVCA